MKSLSVWGASGPAKVVLDCAPALRSFARIGCIDDRPPSPPVLSDHPMLGDRSYLHSACANGYRHFVIAIGSNTDRAACFEIAIAHGLEPVAVIHPSAIVAPTASIGVGTVVMPGAIINAAVRIGIDCIVNTGAVIEHDCVIGDHSHVSPRAALSGAYRWIGLRRWA